jgi:hypothetical protein
MAAWQEAIKAQGFALELWEAPSLGSLRGFLPAQSGESPTGFECYHDDAAELRLDYHDIDFGRPWAYALSLRWGRVCSNASLPGSRLPPMPRQPTASCSIPIRASC